MAPPPEWMMDAACTTELLPDAWFSDYSGNPEYDQTLIQARKICNYRCPVRRQCLEAGLYEEFGVWGGVTERERKRKMRGIPDAPPQKMTSSLGAARRIQALAHLGWNVTDIATDVRRYSGVSVRPMFLEEVRDDSHGQISEELHVALVRSFNRNRTRFNVRGNSGPTINTAKEMGWPTARMWKGIDIDDPKAKPGHDDFA